MLMNILGFVWCHRVRKLSNFLNTMDFLDSELIRNLSSELIVSRNLESNAIS